MTENLFWLTKARFARLRPLLPDKVRGVPRADAPSRHGPRRALYDRFVR